MKRKSIWRRNLWDTKVGKIFSVVCCAWLFYVLVDQGIHGIIEKRASYGGFRTRAYTYTGLNGQILGGAYLSIAMAMILGCVAIMLKNEQHQKVARRSVAVLGIVGLLAWLTAILRELIQTF